MSVKKGDKIKVEYTGTLDDGSEFDSSKKHGKPLEFEAGAGQVIKGFDDAVMEMKVGDEKEFKLEPKDAYGDPNPQLIQKVPKDKMPPEIEKDSIIGVQLQNGTQIPAKVLEVGESEVTLDMNPPLAGKALTFNIKIVGINE